jgi:pimeloyl-ACP methyl ester carboxylesterase
MGLDRHRGGSGEPLVLIHGIGHTWRGWRPMLPRLEERFDVLAVDLPGFGRSEPFPAGIDSTPEALADAVEDEMGVPASSARTWPAIHSAAGSRWSWPGAGALRPSSRSRRPDFNTRVKRTGGGGILRAIRWASKNSPAPEPVMRNPVARMLLLSTVYALGWKKDPQDAMEESELLGSCPGFDATLPHTFHAREVRARPAARRGRGVAVPGG